MSVQAKSTGADDVTVVPLGRDYAEIRDGVATAVSGAPARRTRSIGACAAGNCLNPWRAMRFVRGRHGARPLATRR